MLLLTNIILILAVANTNGQRCEEGWDDKVDDGMDCLLFDTTLVDYDRSKEFCENKKAHLIELSSKEQLKILSHTLDEKDPNTRLWWWGGATKQGSQWKWTTSGELLQQWVWGDYNPNSVNTCFVFTKTNWNSNDVWKGAAFMCKAKISTAICQKMPAITNML